MNFDQWIKTMPRLTGDELAVAKVTWKECKSEVIKILKNNKYNSKDDIHWRAWEEIEKL